MLIVVPFFKNAAYLKETLQSVISQNDVAWKLIVLDDSIDPNEARSAKEVIDSLSDSRISYQKNSENLGLAKNWNQAFDLAQDLKFDLFQILHADDRLKPTFIQEIKIMAIKYPEAQGFFCKAEVIGARGERVFSMADRYKEWILPKEKEIVLSGVGGIEKLIPGNFVFCPTLCYRTKNFVTERFRTDLKMVLDFELLLRILEKGGTWVGYYHEALFQYRRHENNLTNQLNQNLSRFHEEWAIYRGLVQILNAKGYPQIAKKAQKMRVLKLNLGFQMTRSILQFRFKDAYSEWKLFKLFF